MTHEVRHDADGVPTYDGVVTPQGRTGRYAISLPAETPLPVGSVVRIVLDGSEYRTQPVRSITKTGFEIPGVFASARDLRESNASDRHLTPWIESQDLVDGRTVHLDVVVEEFRYGLRAPGQGAVYETSEPENTLRQIAEDL